MLKSIAVLLMTAGLLASCIKDNKFEATPTCAITAFNIGTIKSEVPTKKYDSMGNAYDTLITRTITGSTIFFNIDQMKGHIHTIDSLPNWVDLTAVVPSFTSNGDVYARTDEEEDLFYPVISGSSTLDLSKTTQFMCVSTDGTSTRFYDVDIYKHLGNTDTLEWTAINSNLDIRGEAKFYVTGNKVFAFAKDASDTNVMTYASARNAAEWSMPNSIPVMPNSVVLFGETFYGLDSEGNIYSTPADGESNTWEIASGQQMKRLLAADDTYIYAYDGTNIVGSTDLGTWTVQGSDDLDMLPETSICHVSYASRTNQQMQVAIMAGLSSQNTENSVVWYKTTSTEENINQQWAYIQVTNDNSNGIPHFDQFSMTRYDGALFAIGTTEGKYEYLYRSDDCGITWYPQTQLYPLPEELDATNGSASIVAVNNQLWIIQENGNVWEGSIQ